MGFVIFMKVEDFLICGYFEVGSSIIFGGVFWQLVIFGGSRFWCSVGF